MKKYHEFGAVKEDGKITGFFIKEGGVAEKTYSFFIPYNKFLELVKQNEIQQIYWDSSLNSIGIDREDEVGQTPKKVQKVMAKAPVIEDFNDYLQRDVIFNSNGEGNVIPAAVLLMSKAMSMDMVTIVMLYTKEVEQMHQRIATELPKFKRLFIRRAGSLALSTTIILMEEIFNRISDLGYHVMICMDSVKNAAKTGHLNAAMSALAKPVPEATLAKVESIVTKLNYKTSMKAFKPNTMKDLNAF